MILIEVAEKVTLKGQINRELEIIFLVHDFFSINLLKTQCY